MNPGPIEETGQTARSLIASLKDNPMLLVVVILNVMMFAAVTWAITQARGIELELTRADQQQLGRAMELLSQCINPEALKGLNLGGKPP